MASDPDQSDLRQIRNIGIIAHIDAGKTTTTERILYYTGEIHRMGDVDKGNTTTDYLGRGTRAGHHDRRRGHHLPLEGCRGQPITINIIDTPGHVDFTAEVERSLRVLDGPSSCSRPSRGSRRRAKRSGGRRPSITSRGSASSTRWTASAPSSTGCSRKSQERLLESHPIAVQIPIGAGPEGTMGEFKGLIDLIKMKALYFKTEDLGSTIIEIEIPEDLRPEADLWREKMLNTLSDNDETFTEAYMAHLEGAELSEAMIHAARPAQPP